MATGTTATTPLVIDNITNTYALRIDLTSKAGLSLFAAATKGLADKEKLDISVAKAALFKQEINRAAADYCWGMICARINNDSGTAIDLLEDYKNLKFQNVMDHAATTWGATNNIIAPAGTGGITEDRKQQQI